MSKKAAKEQAALHYAGQKKGYWWKYTLVALIVFIYLLPLYVLLMKSLKSITDHSTPMSFPQVAYWENYLSVIRDGTMLRAYKNSLIITVFAVFCDILIGCMAAYPLARNNSKFNALIRNAFMGVMMIPPLTILVGVYTFLVDIQAINHYWGIVFTVVAFGLPMSVFMFTNFIVSIPRALDEASIIDGANIMQTFLYIILPQLKPIIITIAIIHGVGAWNEYAYSLYILQKPDLATITLTIKQYFSGVTNDYGGAAAAAVLGIVPLIIVYVALQDHFVRGQIDSAIK